MKPRTIKDGPFCWQAKAALRHIADACDGRTDRALALSVYLALTWIASDKQSETFTETKTRIAERAGVSYRKAADVIAFLARLGVVRVSENLIAGTKERGPNTYTLGTVCTTPGTECPRLGTVTEQGSVPRLYEESPEESEKESQEPIAPVGAVGVSSSKKIRKPSKPRERNPLLDALVSVDGSDPAQATRSAFGAASKALADIREVCPDVTPDEIRRRASNYGAQMRDAVITPLALAKHWAKCDRAGRGNGRGFSNQHDYSGVRDHNMDRPITTINAGEPEPPGLAEWLEANLPDYPNRHLPWKEWPTDHQRFIAGKIAGTAQRDGSNPDAEPDSWSAEYRAIYPGRPVPESWQGVSMGDRIAIHDYLTDAFEYMRRREIQR